MKWIILENSNIIRYGYSVGYISCVDKIDILIKLDYKNMDRIGSQKNLQMVNFGCRRTKSTNTPI